MTKRYALRNDQWERIKDLLPGRKETVGVTAKNNRLFVEAVLYRYNECIGRSAGGLSTKIHAICDALGNPTQFYLTSGQAHDLQGADVLLPNVEAEAFLADRAYDAKERVIDKLEAKNCQVVIPPKSNRIEQREYDRHLYKARHLIENLFAKLKQYRGISTRYDKTAVNFLGSIYLAASVIWLN